MPDWAALARTTVHVEMLTGNLAKFEAPAFSPTAHGGPQIQEMCTAPHGPTMWELSCAQGFRNSLLRKVTAISLLCAYHRFKL